MTSGAIQKGVPTGFKRYGHNQIHKYILRFLLCQPIESQIPKNFFPFLHLRNVCLYRTKMFKVTRPDVNRLSAVLWNLAEMPKSTNLIPASFVNKMLVPLTSRWVTLWLPNPGMVTVCSTNFLMSVFFLTDQMIDLFEGQVDEATWESTKISSNGRIDFPALSLLMCGESI